MAIKCPHCGKEIPNARPARKITAKLRRAAREVGKLGGRPVNPNSARQKKLASKIITDANGQKWDISKPLDPEPLP
jgi:hypothetical protein